MTNISEEQFNELSNKVDFLIKALGGQGLEYVEEDKSITTSDLKEFSDSSNTLTIECNTHSWKDVKEEGLEECFYIELINKNNKINYIGLNKEQAELLSHYIIEKLKYLESEEVEDVEEDFDGLDRLF